MMTRVHFLTFGPFYCHFSYKNFPPTEIDTTKVKGTHLKFWHILKRFDTKETPLFCCDGSFPELFVFAPRRLRHPPVGPPRPELV